MSDSVVFTRRDFLRIAGIGAAAAASGCGNGTADRLIPYLVPPQDVLPGVPYWYATTCTECAGGCGILVKAREGRAIKIEGNPNHPISRGGLCARGQAQLQGLYDPDRVTGPMIRQGTTWKKVTWEEGLKAASDGLSKARTGGKSVALVTGHQPGSFETLAKSWAAAAGGTHVVYEAFGFDGLREANRRTFGQATIPNYDISKAKFLISFGADFLETWGTPVAHARDFAAMRSADPSALFVTVEPRLSLTGANADEWIAVRPGGEMALALGMVHVILAEGLGSGVSADVVAAFSPDAVAQQTDVPADTVRRLARKFAAAKPALALAGGIAAQSEQSVAAIAAVNLLNQVTGNVGQTVRFDRTLNVDGIASFADVQRLVSAMDRGEVGAFVVHGANPAYGAPAWAGVPAALAKVPFKLSLSSVLDETTEACDVILPSPHALEMLGDSHTVRGVYSLAQPTMQRLPMFDTRPAGDTLIALAQGLGLGAGMPASWTAHVESTWRGLYGRFGKGRDWDVFWSEARQNGGVWEDVTGGASWSGTPAFTPPVLRGTGDLSLVMYPTLQHHDGRGANKAWLQELPDPVTKIVWGSWVEIHPETAAKLGIRQGDAVEVATDAGRVELPAYLYGGVRPDTIAIPLGQGHTAYGRYAKERGVNATALLSPAIDDASGAVAYLSAKARLSKTGRVVQAAMTQRSKQQADREIGQIIPIAALLGSMNGSAKGEGHGAAAANGHHEAPIEQSRPGKHTEPRIVPEGYTTPAHAITAVEPEHVVRGPRQIPVDQGSYSRHNAKHRWAMSVDLDACTGCSACVIACQAENNIPTVGPFLVQRGREMHWIRIERYEERIAPGAHDVRFVPMMCQQCGDAPCETVCPVYATYHNPEGLNAQVYNRCVGTRYCSNNCPYKVRSFNFFDYSAPSKETFAFPEPLNWQLNPDVTVRSRGVMEKCTFCIQRILEGKGNAKDENREVRDLEIQTACQQSCPSQAIVFGDLANPETAVSKLSREGDRRYWALHDLNTKPAITYQKKIQRETETA